MSEFDYDLFVIGAGSGGVRAARVAAEHGARVAIAEEDRVGGTCVIRGCVPKKLFVHASHFAEAWEDSVGFGWSVDNVRFDWPTLRDNVAADVSWLSSIYIRNLEKSGVELHLSRAVVEDVHRIRLVNEDRAVSAKYILIATGGLPSIDRTIPGIEHVITSNETFHLEKLPKRLVVVGGGYIAVEFAGVFNSFGTDTTLLYRGEEILRGFDGDVRKTVHAGMERRGVSVVCGDTVVAVEKRERGLVATTGRGERIEADQVLFATGRAPNIHGFGLDAVGVAVNADGAIVVDEYSRTNVPTIYAVGDVTNRVRLTPVAIREGSAVAETLFGGTPSTVDYADIPTAVFSQPEAGTVGLTEEEAVAAFPSVDIYRATFKPLQNRVAGRDERMLVKLVVDADTDRVLGFHAVGPNVGELAQLVGIAVRLRATKADFDATVAVHPTVAEEIVTMKHPVERHRRGRADERLPATAAGSLA
ncbi:MAG: glutathione-disulfide reductase [Bauldia sp.]|nr:MAG: glutathione-disulfide reductase [Bauldia sp.]